MRVATLCLIGGLLMVPTGFGPAGYQSSGERGGVNISQNAGRSPTQLLPDFNMGSSSNTGNFEWTDPLVPPLLLGDEPQASHHDIVPPANRTSALYNPLGTTFDFTSDPQAHFHPHGESVCASGCALSNHPTAELSRTKFRRLLAQFANDPMDETSTALETLLYFGRQSQTFLEDEGAGLLDSTREHFLRRQLARTHVLLSFRVVDEHGTVRTEMKRRRIPLDRRHVFEMDVRNLPPLVASGTVKRVGLDHLWTRI